MFFYMAQVVIEIYADFRTDPELNNTTSIQGMPQYNFLTGGHVSQKSPIGGPLVLSFYSVKVWYSYTQDTNRYLKILREVSIQRSMTNS